MELNRFETGNSSFKIGNRKIHQVDKDMFCYINTKKTTYTYYEGRKPIRLTKIILTKNILIPILNCIMVKHIKLLNISVSENSWYEYESFTLSISFLKIFNTPL